MLIFDIKKMNKRITDCKYINKHT